MAGIRVLNPVGPGWSYSLDKINWQEAPVFLTQTDGSDFEASILYTIFCQNPDQELDDLVRVVMGRPTNDPEHTLTLQQVTFNDPLVTSTPAFDGGIVATLPEEPEGANFDEIRIGPDGTFYRRKATVPVTPPVTPGVTITHRFTNFAHYQTQEAGNNPVTPVLLGQTIETPSTANEGATFVARVINTYSSGPNSYYSGAGTFSLDIPYPNGVTFSTAAGVGTFIIPTECIDVTIPASTVRFTFPDGRAITAQTTIVNSNTPPPAEPPVLIQQVLDGPASINEGGSGTARVRNRYSSGPDSFYTGAGTLFIDTPYPDGVTVSTNAGVSTINVPAECVNNNVVSTLRFTFPDGRQITAQTTIVNSNTPPPAPETPVLIQQVLDGPASINEGGSGTARVRNRYSFGPDDYYAGAGTLTIDTPYPQGVTVSTAAGVSTINVPSECVSANVVSTLRFTFPDNRQITAQTTIVNSNTPPSITKVAYSFAKNDPAAGNPGVVEVYAQSDGIIEYSDKWSDTNQQIGYSPMNAGVYQGNSYNKEYGHVGLYPGLTGILYFRKPGQTEPFLTVNIPALPNANTPLTVIYTAP